MTKTRADGLLVIPSSLDIRHSSLLSVHPLVVLRNEDGQLFHHVLGLADRADHACAGGSVPIIAHLLAGVAAPAFDVGVARKDVAIDFVQLCFVQPGFTRAIDIVAVIEHKTGLVGMAEIFEAGDLQAVAILPGIKIINHSAAVAKPNEVEIIFIAHGLDVTEQILVLLRGAIDVTLFVNEPGDLRVGPKLRP